MEENLNKELEEFRKNMEYHGLIHGHFDAYRGYFSNVFLFEKFE